MKRIELSCVKRLIRYGLVVAVFVIALQLFHSRFYLYSPISLLASKSNSAVSMDLKASPTSRASTFSPSPPASPPSSLSLPPPTLQLSGQQDAAKAQQVGSSNPACPEQPPGLLGDKFSVQTDAQLAPSWLQLENDLPYVRHGGCQPENCVAKQRVAIIVPYRNRDAHLRLLLSVLHPMLRRQQLNYRIFVIEQAGSARFNRAMLFNIGYVEARKIFQADCFIFHDVDLLPEHDHNIYRCGSMPRHLSAAIDKFDYRLPYEGIFGGACSLTREQFQNVNGFSNVFFGWGGEDDDFRNRVAWAGYQVSRYPMSIARYKMIKHNRDAKNDPNPQRINLINRGKSRWKQDGLNSLQYTLVGVQDRQVVYFISVDISEALVLRKFNLY